MPPTDPDSLLLDAKALGRLLSLCHVTVFRWDAAGKLPAPVLRKRGCTRWARAEIEEWISANCPNRREWELMQGKRARRFG